MKYFRCEICYLRLPTLCTLRQHYLKGHSKLNIVNGLIKLGLKYRLPKLFGRYAKNEPNESVFCKDNDNILRDNKSSTDENSNERKIVKKRIGKVKTELLPTSASSASSEDSVKRFNFKKRIRKKRIARRRQYKINKRRLRNDELEVTGEFNQCPCGNRKKLDQSTSDTESASDTGRNNNFNDVKVFCSKCGNGYKDESLLLAHMKIHETHCRVCNEIFPTEQSFKEHTQSHIFKVFVCHICGFEFPIKFALRKHFENHAEDAVFESVLDMEQEYNLPSHVLPNVPYQENINSILCYLGNSPNGTEYYCTETSKINCEICYAEVYCGDICNHMRNVHYIYSYNY